MRKNSKTASVVQVDADGNSLSVDGNTLFNASKRDNEEKSNVKIHTANKIDIDAGHDNDGQEFSNIGNTKITNDGCSII